jgi:hypothetical protein
LVLLVLLSARANASTAEFTLHTTSGTDHTGALKQIGPGWSVVLTEEDKAVRAGAGTLISLRRDQQALPAAIATPPYRGQKTCPISRDKLDARGAAVPVTLKDEVVYLCCPACVEKARAEPDACLAKALLERDRYLILANGDVLPLAAGKPLVLHGEELRGHADFGEAAEVKLPLSAVAMLWLSAPDGTDHADQLRRALAAAKRSRDAVYLRNGDVVEGVLTALDARKLEIDVDRKEVTIELAKVALVALNTELTRLAPPAGPYARIVLANGARLTLASAQADATQLTGKPIFGGEVQVPLADLVALDVRQGPAVYLSDLKPAKYEFRPFTDVRWPSIADGNIWNGDLRLAGSTYDKGLGTYPQSRLTYTLAGGYQRFEVRVGLDDRAAAIRGVTARIRVLVDGKPGEGRTAELTRTGQSVNLRVDVRGAKELTLAVEFVLRPGLVPGPVNWADARLIRAAKQEE